MRLYFLLLAVLYTVSADAHHYKGLPHYSYFKNYPQVPVLEFSAQELGYEIFATVYNFQGLNLDQVDSPDDVRFYVYIFDSNKNSVYLGKVDYYLLSGSSEILTAKGLSPEQESVYFVQGKVETKSNLVLKASFLDDSGKQVTLSLPVQIAPEFIEKYGMYIAIAGFFFAVVSVRLAMRFREKKKNVVGLNMPTLQIPEGQS